MEAKRFLDLLYDLVVNSFSPANIPGLLLWLKADAIVGLSNNDPVTTWADSSGNNRDATQSTGSQKPLYKTGVYNNLPVLDFDGVDDNLTTPSFTVPNPCTVFLVMHWKGSGVFADSDFVYSDFAGGFQLWGPQGSTQMAMRMSDQVTFGTAPRSKASIVMSISDTTPEFYVNGVLQNIGAQHPGTYTGPGMYIGESQAAGTTFAAMQMAELLIYDTQLSSANRLAVQAYLHDKYAIV